MGLHTFHVRTQLRMFIAMNWHFHLLSESLIFFTDIFIKTGRWMICEIWGSRDDNHEGYCILGCDTMQGNLKMAAAGCSKISVHTYHIIQHHIPEHSVLQVNSSFMHYFVLPEWFLIFLLSIIYSENCFSIIKHTICYLWVSICPILICTVLVVALILQHHKRLVSLIPLVDKTH